MREKEFLEFNIDNIFTNLYQAEDHLRRLSKTDNDEGHASCVFKHLSFVAGELLEAISHSAVVEPELVPEFQRMLSEVNEIRDAMGKISVPEAIRRVRKVRKEIEKLDKRYNTDFCEACGKALSQIIERIENENVFKQEKQKNINEKPPKKTLEGGGMNKKTVTTIVAAQFGAKGVEEVGKYIDNVMGKTGAQVYERPSTWINIGGGLLGVLGSLYFFEDNPELQLVSAIVGSHMLTKLVDYARETAGVGGLSIIRPAEETATVQGFVDNKEVKPTFESLVSVD